LKTREKKEDENNSEKDDIIPSKTRQDKTRQDNIIPTNETVDIIFSAHNAFLEKLSSGDAQT